MHDLFIRRSSAVVLFFAGLIVPVSARAAPRVQISVLSSQPDMVTGGDALVQVTQEGADSRLTIWLNGRDVTGVFRVSPLTHNLLGIVNGLAAGKSRVAVRSGRKVLTRLDLVNHETSGPLFSGPYQNPFVCQTEQAGLGPARNADCSARTQVVYVYKSSQPLSAAERAATPKPGAPPPGFKLYVASGPRPPDLAEVTTTQGKTVPYIVRWERGTINRAIYEIAFLHEPGTPLPDPWTTTEGWNARLVYSFGGGCNAGYRQARAPSAVDDQFLSFGYAHATSSLNVFGNTCNDVISAETAALVKEHFIKHFGVPVHTIGWGGSGGSMQQHLIAQNYPGLLDGIIVSLSYPDTVTIIPGIVDCTLLAHAFEVSKLTWTEEEKTTVCGFATWGTCASESKGNSWIKLRFSPDMVAPQACDAIVPHTLIYDPAGNRRGARCDLYDNQINIYGADAKTGFARRPLDNVGVQYGLRALNRGIISTDQFLGLNETIGGYDQDGNITAARMIGDPEALRIAYATGRVNAAGGALGSIPIMDIRTYLDTMPDIHDEYRSFVMRARLAAANGSADNQVMLTYPRAAKKPGAERGEVVKTFVPLMDEWLDNLAKDNSPRSVMAKIAAARPDGLADACWSEEGDKIVEARSYDGSGRCNQIFPPHGDPRTAAGEPLREDILKCALKPVDPRDYVHPLTGDQLARLRAIFPQGVCDYTRPGVGQVPLDGSWRTY